jgi:hypothetical protein
VRNAKKRSTWFNQELLVGVRWTCQRGRLSSSAGSPWSRAWHSYPANALPDVLIGRHVAMNSRAEKRPERHTDGHWCPGHSGNPRGRPRGARAKATLAVEAILQGELKGLARKAIELALAGDTTALRLCLERLMPPARGRHVQ